jgi:hypothetical protein
MSDTIDRAQARACLERAGLRLTDAELDQVLAFHSPAALELLRGVEEARYEFPALSFDPLASLREWGSAADREPAR